jgi:Uncharacterized conserved protein
LNLHKDVEAFKALLLKLSEQKAIRVDILEKDYYVSLLLREIAQNQKRTHAYFKGGTALYKALKSIRRFSEDIDLTVDISTDCPTNNQKKRRLELAAHGYHCLKRNTEDDENENRRGSITSVFSYEPCMAVGKDPLQRFARVKVEATSFTTSRPFNKLIIAPLIYDFSDDTQKDTLKNQFDVCPFPIETITLERIFVDKVFATEFYFDRYKSGDERTSDYAFELCKHLYDITVLYGHSIIQNLMKDIKKLKTIVQYKREEEKERRGGIPDDVPICDFVYLSKIFADEKLESFYNEMQKIYVFQDKEKLQLSDSKGVISALRHIDF